MKTVYQTDDKGFFVGAIAAEQSPLEPGVFLIPAGCVEIEPPAIGANEAAKFNGTAWEKVPDFRGAVYWLADHSKHEIKERGEIKPAGAFDADPPKTQAEIDAQETAAALSELYAIDIASIRAIREYIAAKPDAPQILKDREAAAIAARARIK